MTAYTHGLFCVTPSDQKTNGIISTRLARFFMTVSFIVSDVIAIVISAVIALLIRNAVFGHISVANYLWLPIFILFFVISSASRGLYDPVGIGQSEQFKGLVFSTSITFFFVVTSTHIFRINQPFTRLIIGLSWLLCLLLIPLFRAGVRQLLTNLELWGEPIIVIGTSSKVELTQSYFNKYPKIGLRPVQLVKLVDDFSFNNPKDVADLVAALRNLHEITKLETVIFIYERTDDFPLIRSTFRDLFEYVILLNESTGDDDLGGVRINQYGNKYGVTINHSLLNRSARVQKKILDIFVSTIGLIISLPLFFIISLAIMISSPGGIFYRQKRIGEGGKEFDLLKFRTMHEDADLMLAKVLESNPLQKQEWDQYQKLKKDPRITFIGGILRKSSLDELPQLINVLGGTMSIVGPRPIMKDQISIYGKNFENYIRVTPGLTGLWQISGRNRTTFQQRIDFDKEYINNWSVWLDFYIIVRTLWVLFRRDGAN